MPDLWPETLRNILSKIAGFLRDWGGPISILLVVVFSVILWTWGGTSTFVRPLPGLSLTVNVLWGAFTLFAMLAALFGASGDSSELWAIIRKWGGLIALVLLLVVPIMAHASSGPPSAAPRTPWFRIIIVLATTLILIVPVALRFVFVCTQPLNDNNPKAAKLVIDQIVRFCYLFMLAALFISFAPAFALIFIYLTLPKPDDIPADAFPRVFYNAMVDSPVGLVRGCVHSTSDPTWELACRFASQLKDQPEDLYAVQWMMNIGGSAQWRAVASGATPTPPANPPLNQLPGSSGAASNTPVPAASPEAAAPPPAPETNLEPALAESLFYPVTVHGGLAVPWYFVMLAVMGGAVSMARRVPEYQRRVNYGTADSGAEGGGDGTGGGGGQGDGAHGRGAQGGGGGAGGANTPGEPKDAKKDDDSESLSPSKAREYLVFQLLQVLSAPLLAITAYNVLTPTSRATSVTLAFVSGFASESVLVAIRSIADKIKPDESK